MMSFPVNVPRETGIRVTETADVTILTWSWCAILLGGLQKMQNLDDAN